MIRLVFFIALGLFLGGGAVALIGPPGAGIWALVTGFAVALVSGIMVSAARRVDADPMGRAGRDAALSAAEAGPPHSSKDAPLRAGGARRRPLIGIGRRGRVGRFIVFGIACVAAAAVVIAPYRTALAQTVQAVQHGQLRPDMRSSEFLPQAIEALQREIGHDRLVDVTVLRDFVIVEAPVTPGSRDTDSWMFRGGVVSHDGPALIQPDSEHEQFAAGDVAWDGLWPGVERAAAETGFDDLSDVTLSVSRGTDLESEERLPSTGPVEVIFWFDGDYDDAWFRMNADGANLVRTDDD